MNICFLTKCLNVWLQEGTLNSGSDVLISRMETLLPNLVKNLETPADVEARGTRRTFEKVSRVLDVFSSESVLYMYF